MNWQYMLIATIVCAAIAGVAGYYLDRDELICIRLEK